MRSIAFAVVIFAAILAYSSAAPQLNLAWLQGLLAEAGETNSTVKFGNNTVIISGVSNAHANANEGTIRPRPQPNQWNNNQGWNYYGYPSYYNGYYRMVPTVNGQIVEGPQTSLEESQEISQEVSHEISHDLSDQESGEDQYSQEAEADLLADKHDEEEEEQLDAEEYGEEEGEPQTQEAEDEEDEQTDPEEDAADQALDVFEKELEAEEAK
ncbi:tripartite motif-containing protein 44 [Drosophila takahashii]|uniref:tripartite motif-containing protein 44 n=1 Tax=Drosophila takahashii TaxID=29030 RepID=UPI001CF83D16|nr:glutamic acid-rich protein [Drosophila takahashii]